MVGIFRRDADVCVYIIRCRSVRDMMARFISLTIEGNGKHNQRCYIPHRHPSAQQHYLPLQRSRGLGTLYAPFFHLRCVFFLFSPFVRWCCLLLTYLWFLSTHHPSALSKRGAARRSTATATRAVQSSPAPPSSPGTMGSRVREQQ